MGADRLVKAVIALGAAFFGAIGAWAFADPSSFYEEIATYPPYNRHFLHDLGAFQLGLGAALLLALTRLRGREVALWAVSAAAVMHAVSHFLDRDLGGRSSDPYTLTAFAALLVLAAAIATGRRTHATDPPADGLRPDRAPRPPQQV